MNGMKGENWIVASVLLAIFNSKYIEEALYLRRRGNTRKKHSNNNTTVLIIRNFVYYIWAAPQIESCVVDAAVNESAKNKIDWNFYICFGCFTFFCIE